MNLIIDLGGKSPAERGKIKLILKKNNKEIASHSWTGLYQLSETLISEIDMFLKKNKVKLEDIKEMEVVPSKESLVSTRIAKAVALGLKVPA